MRRLSKVQERLEAALRGVTAEIERLTGLPSQWNQRVDLVPTSDRAFGGKTFTCLVRIRADIAKTDLLWPTLLHEAFHCFSVERHPDASLDYPGYEEGVVEQLQRLFRQELLASLHITVGQEALVDRDKNSAYTDYIEALEAMRTVLEIEPKPFYITLLGTPLEQREDLLRTQAQQHPAWRNAPHRQHWRQWERILQGEDN